MSSLLTVQNLPLLSSDDMLDFFASLLKSTRIQIAIDLEVAIKQTSQDVNEENPEIEASLLRLQVIKLCLHLTEEEVRDLQ